MRLLRRTLLQRPLTRRAFECVRLLQPTAFVEVKGSPHSAGSFFPGEGVLVCRAIGQLMSGQRLTLNYGPADLVTSWPLEKRREYLLDRCGFVCGCERCVQEEGRAGEAHVQSAVQALKADFPHTTAAIRASREGASKAPAAESSSVERLKAAKREDDAKKAEAQALARSLAAEKLAAEARERARAAAAEAASAASAEAEAGEEDDEEEDDEAGAQGASANGTPSKAKRRRKKKKKKTSSPGADAAAAAEDGAQAAGGAPTGADADGAAQAATAGRLTALVLIAAAGVAVGALVVGRLRQRR